MGANPKIVEIRELLAEKFPIAPQKQHDFFVLDEGVEGVPALPKGAISEISGSLGGGSLFLQLLIEAAHRQNCFCALIDGHGSFSPQSCERTAHLLWVRCAQAMEAIRAADILVHDGNLPLLILDLRLIPLAQVRRIEIGQWYRLERHIENTRSALIVLTARPVVSCARLRLHLQNHWSLKTMRQSRRVLMDNLDVMVERRMNKQREIA